VPTRSIDQLAARVLDLAELAPLSELAARPPRHGVYLVGGGLRDLILGRPLLDVDLATEGEASELAARLGASGAEATRFGTVTVALGGLRYDIARTRRERYPQPGALPEVEPADIDADLLRRDFTVNAIAVGVLGPRTGEVVAAPRALDDLASRRLAVLHDTSFLDDPTRLLRLARYAARLGFEVAPQTRQLAEHAIASGALSTISGTRLGNELRLLAAEPDPVAAFRSAADLGLPWSLDTALATRALHALPPDGRPDLLVLALALIPPGSKDSPARGGARGRLIDELDQLGFTATDRETITEAATQAPALADRLAQARSRSEIARAVGNAGAGTVALASALGPPEPAQRWLEELRHVRLEITGDDLVGGGVPQGPAVGRGLTAARDALLDGSAPDRASQLEVALRAAR